MLNRADRFVERVFGKQSRENEVRQDSSEPSNSSPKKTTTSEMFKLLDKRRANLLELRRK